MTQTLQSRVEIFAAAVVAGNTQADAYRKAYPTSAAWTNQKVAEKASTFSRRPDVKARMTELREKAMEANEITTERILREVASLAFLDVRKLFDDDGRVLGISKLDDATAAAIAGLDVATVGNAQMGVGEVLKLKLADKKGALELLMRHKGMLNDKLKLGEDTDNPLNSLVGFLQAGAGRIKPGSK